MSLSTCDHCGGHIPLGPDASNCCEVCGRGLWDGMLSVDSLIQDRKDEARASIYRKSLETIRANAKSQLDGMNSMGTPDDDPARINAAWVYTESTAALRG